MWCTNYSGNHDRSRMSWTQTNSVSLLSEVTHIHCYRSTPPLRNFWQNCAKKKNIYLISQIVSLTIPVLSRSPPFFVLCNNVFTGWTLQDGHQQLRSLGYCYQVFPLDSDSPFHRIWACLFSWPLLSSLFMRNHRSSESGSIVSRSFHCWSLS